MLVVILSTIKILIYIMCEDIVYSKELLIASEFQNKIITYKDDDVKGWSQQIVRTCEQTNIYEYSGEIFGVFSQNITQNKKIYTQLLPHWSALVRLDLMLYGSVDSNENDFAAVQLDNNEQNSFTKYAGDGYKICSNSHGFWGNLFNDQVYPYQKNITHNTNALTVQFNSQFTGDNPARDYEGYAFKHLSVYIDTCYETCSECTGPTAAQCKKCILNANFVNNICKCGGSKVAYNFQCIDACPFNYVANPDTGICEKSKCSSPCGNCVKNKCTSCNFPSKLLIDECVNPCPTYSVDQGTYCEDKIKGLAYGGYIFKGLYSKTFGDSEIQGEGLKLVNFKSNATFSSCQGDRIVGGWNIAGGGSEIRRELPTMGPHWSIRIGFKYYLIDDWENEVLQVYLDDKTLMSSIPKPTNPSAINICGINDKSEYIGTFDMSIIHISSSLTITIKNNIDVDKKSAFQASFGIREFYVLINYCQPVCDQCEERGCTKCPKGTFQYNYNCGTDCPTGYWKNTVNNSCDLCGGNCVTCDLSATSCLSCKPGTYLSLKSCSSTCPDGTAPNTSTLTCDKCHLDCKTCTKPNDNTTCKSCDGNLFLSGTQCISNCPDGKYGDTLTHVCTTCDLNCKTCKGSKSSDCLSCASGKLYQPVNNTCGSACNSNQYINGNNCTPCDTTCLTCTGGTANDCKTCKDRYLSGTQCLATCPDKFYNDQPSFTCKSCESSCFNCTGPSNTNCTQCTGTLYLNSGGKCLTTCPTKYFQNAVNNKCDACDVNCLTCETSKVNCTSCNTNQVLDIDGVCKASCASGKWTNTSTKKCELCNSNCKTCDVASKDICTSCSDPNYLDKKQKVCVSTCPQKSFGNKSTQTCDLCETTCAECTGSNSNQCTKCSDQLYLTNNQCKTVCPSGTFANSGNNTCTQCDTSKCLECVNSNDQCTKCKSPTYLSGTACIETCPDGFYGDKSNRICAKCNDSCEKCRGPLTTDCTNCTGGKFYDPVTTTCVENCQTGYFKNPQNHQCENCDHSCQECSGPQKQQCTQCPPNVILHENQCITECPEKYFKDPNQFLCNKCFNDCFKCIDEKQNSCTKCQGTLYLTNKNTCESVCDEGFYENNTDNTCTKCDNSCQDCSGPGKDKCTKCSNNTYLEDNHCKTDCLVGWENPANHECSPCKPDCSKCFGPESNNCDECPNGTFLNPDHTCQSTCPEKYFQDKINNKCLKCDSSCKNCTDSGQDKCIECDGSLFLKDGKYCSNSCNQKEFGNGLNNKCEPCDDKCDTCIDKSNSCTGCKNGKFLTGKNCESDCPAGTFKDTSNNKCTGCNSDCLTCTGSSKNECKSCQSGTFLKKDTTNCVSSCPIKFYADSSTGKCEECVTGCDNCTNNQVCQKCTLGYYLINNICSTTCPDKYFKNDECTQCYKTCQSCSNSTKNGCDSCIDSTFMNNDDKSCRYNNECPSNMYPDPTTKKCELCHLNCTECSGKGENSCTICPTSKLIYKGECLSNCPDKTFINNEKCVDCHQSCSSCTTTSEFSCTNCPLNKILQEGVCIDNCVGHFYPAEENGIKICKVCNDKCTLCTGPSVKECTECQADYFRLDTECIVSCPEKYTYDSKKVCLICAKSIRDNTCIDSCRSNEFTDPTTLKCTQCSPQCTKCNGPTEKQCQSCESGFYLKESNNECSADCPNKFFPDKQNRKCTQCDPSCDNCSGPGSISCSSCILPQILFQGKCLKDTPEGHFKDEDKHTFEKCDKSCKTCDGPKPTDCLTCLDSLFQKEKSCLKECPDTYYNDKSKMVCSKCSGQCVNCQSPEYCLSCTNNQYSFQGTCKPACDTKTQYQDELKKQCILCHSSCQSDGCSGPDESDCLGASISSTDSLIVKILAFKTVLWVLSSVIGTLLDYKNAKLFGKGNQIFEANSKQGHYVSDQQVQDLRKNVYKDNLQEGTHLNENKSRNRRKRNTFIRKSMINQDGKEQLQNFQKQNTEDFNSQDPESPMKRQSTNNLSSVQQSQMALNYQQSNYDLNLSPTQRSPDKSMLNMLEKNDAEFKEFKLKARPVQKSTMAKIDQQIPTFNNWEDEQSSDKNEQNPETAFSSKAEESTQESSSNISYPKKLYFTVIGNELISVFSLYDPNKSRLFRASMIYVKYMILFLMTYVSNQQSYGIAAAGLFAAIAGKGLLSFSLSSIGLCLRKSGVIALIFIMGLVGTDLYFWFIPKIKSLTYNFDLNWSVVYIITFTCDFLVIQSMISFISYVVTVRSKFIDNKAGGNKILNFLFKQPALLAKIK